MNRSPRTSAVQDRTMSRTSQICGGMTGASRHPVAPAARVPNSQVLLNGGAQALSAEGNLAKARDFYDAAYVAAEAAGDAVAMGMAAVGLGGLWVHEHRSSATAALVEVRLRNALSLLDAQSSLALRLRTRLIAEADYRAGEHARILETVEEARGSGNPTALADALSLAHHCLLGPGHSQLRHALAGEMIATGFRTERRSDLLVGLLWRTVDLLMDADPHAERCLSELRAQLAQQDHLAVGFVVDAIDVMLTIRAGRLEEAEVLAGACAERGRRAGDVDATGWYWAHLVAIRWYQGRIAEVLPAMKELANSPTLSAIDNSFAAALAVAAAASGDRRLAEGAVAQLTGRGLRRLPRSSSWLVTMCALVEAAYLTEDAEAATQAYELLTPFAGLPMVGSIGIVCFGSVQQALGMAALTAGNLDQAVEHLRTAVQENVYLGHWPAAALSRSRLALALALRAVPGDAAEMEEALSSSLAEAAELGMTLPDWPAKLGVAPNRNAKHHLVACRRKGTKWSFELGRHAALVEDSVGMGYIATLLANPGCAVPAVELAAGPGLRDLSAAKGAASSGQPVLDDAAIRAYRRQLAQLQQEVDEHEANNDLVRAERVRSERDWLTAELTAATGLGGRVRQFSGNEERARVSVGKAIRRALERIAQTEPAIAENLRASIHTGVRCCYQPC